MTHPHDDSDPIEHDPTGMRALLGSLPDPSPMPQDLIRRIEAALADEARSTAGWAAPECPPQLRADEGGHRATVLALPGPDDLGGARVAAHSGEARVLPLSRRSPWRALGVAAAVIAVLGVGGLVIETNRPGGLQAALGVSEDSAASGGDPGLAQGSEGVAAPKDLRAAATLVIGSDALRVQVVGGGLVLASADLRSVATGLPSTVPGDGGATRSAQGPAVSSPAAGRACATALGVPASDRVLLAPATVDDQPAVLVLSTADSGARTAWAVRPSCSPASADVIAGPVPAG